LPFLGAQARFVGGGSGNWTNGTITGYEEWRILTPKHIGFYEGDMIGNYPLGQNSSFYEMVSLGSFHLSPLKFYAQTINSTYFNPNFPLPIANATFYLGSEASLWNSTIGKPALTLLLGDRLSGNSTLELILSTVKSFNDYSSTYTSYEGGAFQGNIVGFYNEFSGEFSNIPLLLFTGLFKNNSNQIGLILLNNYDYDRYFYSSINAYEGELPLYVVPLGVSNSTDFSLTGFNFNGTLTGNIKVYTFYLNFNGSITSYNYITPVFQHITGHPEFGTFNLVLWGNSTHLYGHTEHELKVMSSSNTGNLLILYGYSLTEHFYSHPSYGYPIYGALANLEVNNPMTGIVVGNARLEGPFTSYDWFIPMAGVYLETNKLLELLNSNEGRIALKNLQIPSVEVGRVTLTGSGTKIPSLTMEDVVFLAPTSRHSPRLWATNKIYGIYGTYLDSLSTGDYATLTGGGLSVLFIVKQWSDNKWSALINGTGVLGIYDIGFEGWGAGNFYNNGTFLGTGAGYVMNYGPHSPQILSYPSALSISDFTANIIRLTTGGLYEVGNLTGSILVNATLDNGSFWNFAYNPITLNATINSMYNYGLIKPTLILGNGTPLGNGTFIGLLSGYYRNATSPQLRPYAHGFYLSPQGTLSEVEIYSDSDWIWELGEIYLDKDNVKHIGLSASNFTNFFSFGNFTPSSSTFTRHHSYGLTSVSLNNTFYYLNATYQDNIIGILTTLTYGNYSSNFNPWVGHSYVGGRLPFLDQEAILFGKSSEEWYGVIDGEEDWTILTPKYVGSYKGKILGIYSPSSNNYEIVSIGPYKLSPLKFYARTIDSTYHPFNPPLSVANATFYLGSKASLWNSTKETPAWTLLLGERSGSDSPNIELVLSTVRSYNAITGNHSTYEGGTFQGNIIGGYARAPGQFHFKDLLFTGLFRDDKNQIGLILNENRYFDFHPLVNFYNGSFSLYVVPLGNVSSTTPFEITGFNPSLPITGNGTFTIQNNSYTMILQTFTFVNHVFQHILGQERFGIFNLVVAGNSTVNIDPFGDLDSYTLELNSSLTTGNPLILYTKYTKYPYPLSYSDGLVYGAFANRDLNNPITGIVVGRSIGLSNSTHWVLPMSGMYLETNKLLDLLKTAEGQRKLRDLNVPAVEVGRVTLTGSGGSITNLTMRDTIFLAPSSREKPLIWATGSVTGTYSGNPLNTSVNISGGGLTASFTINQWDNGKWTASITGSGTLSTHQIEFKGLGAGQYGGNNFTGTAAGYVK
ncbi:MAG: hypothetical protein RMI63_08700, partial [Caldimicrobium sp.]|nr:hypothetical protein [Caldimicrobium sp.]